MSNSISAKALQLLTLGLGLLSTAALLIAQTSSSTCAMWAYEQPKMPKSLIKND